MKTSSLDRGQSEPDHGEHDALPLVALSGSWLTGGWQTTETHRTVSVRARKKLSPSVKAWHSVGAPDLA